MEVYMKGIILAGGLGTRFHPASKAFSKQLFPLYDKPMIYYPLSTLMLAGIRDVLIITTSKDLKIFKDLFHDGSQLGMRINYEVQSKPNGIAEAFLIGEKFIGTDSVCLILGDNIFYGQGLTDILTSSISEKDRAVIFGYKVSNPSHFGIANLVNGKIVSIEEKPRNPESNLAIPGLYFYPNDVIVKTKLLSKSDRGELEISSLNQLYLDEGRLILKKIGRGIAWLDTGTPESLRMASEYVSIIQERQGDYIACIEEISFRRGFITKEKLLRIANELSSSEYGKYLMGIVEGNH
jgi:glucose-1-phosphate thymidylyltransferase